ncbi:hypothetical protein COY93_00970 [Candidatus Uhrbacteria bacterium CG_4_10_14_0_8_um_filter_58_22]|uniref:Cohesin domain-containing protein n=1 Tax=Candidatus Uhrbacteria bacterium CG_4_10_14_0_8_um_filter_58_22 TaxID=1975029 RepID=A0A2M7QAQ0_9BACT|nr:MAG: hypothetical protein AUJ19_03580 [Parcubacteria group bacterium CG1_02_58_44]PIY63238.1 MAG: hypothetical protein COY93_00970 [Candidatus Uhrbacteria bacterium CG_4_10_14_0_8_um_filter_58_22]
MENKSGMRWFFTFPALAIIAIVLILASSKYGKRISYLVRGQDDKPTIDFTWIPLGRVRLTEMVGQVFLEDDYALDFSTFKIEVVEIGKVLRIAREDLVGREYTDRVSFAQLAGNPEINMRGQMTLRISVADDRGQLTEIERVIKINPELGSAEMKVTE